MKRVLVLILEFVRSWLLIMLLIPFGLLFAENMETPVDNYKPPTEVSGTIAEDTVWTIAQSPYLVRATITISPNVILTIEPGVEVLIVQNQDFIVNGTLRAVGNEANPIVFTGTAQVPGWWRSINIQGEGSAYLEWCEVSFAGASTGAGVLKSGTGSLRLVNSVVRRVRGDGLRISAGYSSFESINNAFMYNTNGIRLGINASYSDQSSTFISNEVDIHLDGGAITGIVKWGASGDYSMTVTGDVSINAGASLEIVPGTVVKLRQNNRFLVYGQFQARGVEDQQIYFTDLRDDTVGGDSNRDGSETLPEKGWWRSINIQNEGSAVLEWCTIAYGGRSDGATLLKSGTGSIRISNSAIVRSSGDGLRVTAGYSLFESSDNYFGYNSVGLRLGINASFSDLTSHFESNDLDVHLDGGTISSSVVWGASSEYSMVTGGDIVVAAGASLKVMPGTVIKLKQNNRILVYGHLEAAGQDSAPIYFTDFRNDLVGGDANRDGEDTSPASGWWRSINLLTEGTANFEYCTIGYLGVSDMAGVIKSSTGAFSILNSTIHDVTGDGLRIDNAAGGAEVRYSTLSYNTGAGLYYKTDGVQIEALTIASNGIGIRLPAGCSVEVDEQTYFDGNNIAIQIDPATISGKVTWGAPDYISILMNGSVSVASGASLTVKPGSVVKIAQNALMAVDGELIASGTEENPIFFTETRDDSVGGVIPGDGSLPEAGWWRSINIRNEGKAIFDWCRIAYAGRSDGAAILKSGTGSLRISNSVLSNTSGDGLRLSAGYSSFEHFQNEYSDNTIGVRLGINASFADVTTTFEDNSTDIHLDGGAISVATSWGSSSDYSMVITGDVSIAAGASLSILPGTVVKFRQNNRILVYGSLKAIGEADLPIYFTDLRDDLVGGDANRDGEETTPAPGWWRSIGIMTDGTASFEHCVIRYAGYGDRSGVLKSSTGAVSMTDTVIEKVAGDGFRADNAAGGVKIARSTFSENSEAGLNCRTDGVSVEESVFVSNDTGVRAIANGSLVIDDKTYFSENSKDIYVEAATISGRVIWRVPEHLSLLLSGSTSITRDARLEIKPGTVVKMAQNSLITVDGEFIALGTEEEPVFFTDQRDDSAGGDSNRDADATLPVKGWWNSINIRESGSAELDFVDIGYSQNGIVRAGSGSFTLTNSTIHDVSGDALKILAGYSSLNLSNNHFLRNGTGVRMAVNVSFDDPLARFEENAIDVHVDGGTIDADTVFGLSSEYSFYISAEITVSKDATLEIRPGTVLKFAEYRGLRISGRLKSIGTEEEPITFTDWRDDSAGGDANHDGDASLSEPGWWRSIYIQEEGSAELEWAQVMYGGYGDKAGIFKTGSGSLSVRNISVSNTAGDGLQLSNSTGFVEVIESSFFGNSTGVGISSSQTAPISFADCIFEENAVYGVRNDSQVEVVAVDCWWGDITGPHHPSLNYRGTGNSVSDNVIFDPWIGKDELMNETESEEVPSENAQEVVQETVLAEWIEVSSDGLCYEVPSSWFDDSEGYRLELEGDENSKPVSRWFDAESGSENIFFVIARVKPEFLEDEKEEIRLSMEVVEESERLIAGEPGIWIELTAPQWDVERTIYSHVYQPGEDGYCLSIGFAAKMGFWSQNEPIFERIMDTVRYCVN
ncbi:MULTISPECIES: right-handed parallel beta-helix repeat-containing protein [unclassified Mesotoga]|uniref:right-handed parallel beta-helix repeat-containing protein n=1 Tax=unclassified Mesotoga TaxID=1184398 RepID=UPI000DA6719D|nr:MULTISPECIES: right-handed parallel beta-helix repeat-containing protein [unclassified Mesotoga]PZC51814.1 hypothetical protein LH53_08940 [Mesotoga sp. TolDC]